MKAKTLIGQRTFSKLPALRISTPSAKHRHRKLKQRVKKGDLWLTKIKWIKGLRFRRRQDKKQSAARRTPVERPKISARRKAQWPMNIWAAQKTYGMMRFIASAVFRTTASNTSARTRRRRSLPHSE